MGKYRPSEDSDLSESDLGRSSQLQKKKKKSNGTKKKDVTPVRAASKKKSSIPPVRKPNNDRSLSAKSVRSSEPFQLSDSKSDFSPQEAVVQKSKVRSPSRNGAQKTQNRVSDIRQTESYRRKSPAKKVAKATANKRSSVQEHYESESGYDGEQNSSSRSADEKIGRGGYQDTKENTSERSDPDFENQGDAELATAAEPARAKTVSESLPTENQDQEMTAKQNDLEAGARGESSGRSTILVDVEAPDIRERVESSAQHTSPVVVARLPPEIILADACVNTGADLSADQVGQLPVNSPDARRDDQGDTSDRNTLDYWLNMLNNEGPDAEGTTSKALDLWAKDVAIKREQANADLVKEKALYVRQKRLRLSRLNT